MAGAQAQKKSRDYKISDDMWKVYIQTEAESEVIWKENWGWILVEYADLKKKLDEKTKHSEYLQLVVEGKKHDPRKLVRRPVTINHEYGWVASHEECILEKYGPDFFKPIPLPPIFRLLKHDLKEKN